MRPCSVCSPLRGVVVVRNTLPFIPRGCKGSLRPTFRYRSTSALAPVLITGGVVPAAAPSRSGGRWRGYPCRPCSPLPAALPPRPAAVFCWVSGASGWGLVSGFWFIGGVYVWFCVCGGFASGGGCGGSAFVVWLGVGAAGVAWWRWVASCPGLFVCAVWLVFVGFAVCAGRGFARLAGVGACGVGGFAGVFGVCFAGSGVCG